MDEVIIISAGNFIELLLMLTNQISRYGGSSKLLFGDINRIEAHTTLSNINETATLAQSSLFSAI